MLTVIKQHWTDSFGNYYDKYLIIDLESESSVMLYNYKTESWICSLYVQEEFRNKGISKILLNKCEELSTNLPIKVGVIKNAPEWLIKYYKNRNYNVIIT